MDEVLDMAFPPEHCAIPPYDPNYDRAITREVVNQIPGPAPSLMQEEVDNWWRETRKLFGNVALKEYSHRAGKPYKTRRPQPL